MKFSAACIVLSALLVGCQAASLIVRRQSGGCTCGGEYSNSIADVRAQSLTANTDNSYSYSDIDDAISAAEDGGAG